MSLEIKRAGIMPNADNKRFWNRYARIYDFEIERFNKAAYQEMYQLMASSLTPDMEVLELATGTGLIACGISGSVKSVLATDFSPKMIAVAQKKQTPSNISFAVEDATALTFSDNSFDAVIISNALHIIPSPELALSHIKRVLRPDGTLIAPTFSHGHLKSTTWNLNARILRRIGFETYSKWTPEEYVAFISANCFTVKRWSVLKASFPLVYLEACPT